MRSPTDPTNPHRARAACRIGRAFRIAVVCVAEICIGLAAVAAISAIAGVAGARAGDVDAKTATAADPARLRLVSLNPSLTAILGRIGAGETLVGIDDYSARIVPALARLPRVGGLFDPSLEAVLALAPDRVLLVAGLEQEAHARSLRRLGLVVEVFENETYADVLDNIARLGRLVARSDAAAERIAAVRGTRDAVERAVRGRPRPRTLIVLDRSPLYLVGGETFLDELLLAVGALNLGAEIGRGYPQASLEWLVEAAPELLLDLSPQAETGASPAEFWARWPSLPAVERGRVVGLDATAISLPGPDLDAALRTLARAVHGDGIDAAITAELERSRNSGESDAPDDGRGRRQR